MKGDVQYAPLTPKTEQLLISTTSAAYRARVPMRA